MHMTGRDPHCDAKIKHVIKFHQLANMFPELNGAEFDELAADIRARGVHEPIWLYDGQILDGRNRYRAAKAAGIDCPTRTYDGPDPLSLVVSANLRRRHLNESLKSYGRR